jgi:biotin carboxyl carrier protein
VKYKVTTGDHDFEIEIERDHLVRVNGKPVYVDFEQIGGLPAYSLSTDEAGYVVFVEEKPGAYKVEVQGQVFPVSVQQQRPQLPPRAEDNSATPQDRYSLTAPLAGHIASLAVTTGDRVKTGQTVVTVESMKMQMELKAPMPAIVEEIHAQPGQDVRQDEELMTLQRDHSDH